MRSNRPDTLFNVSIRVSLTIIPCAEGEDVGFPLLLQEVSLYPGIRLGRKPLALLPQAHANENSKTLLVGSDVLKNTDRWQPLSMFSCAPKFRQPTLRSTLVKDKQVFRQSTELGHRVRFYNLVAGTMV
jgi:hypothetical protein